LKLALPARAKLNLELEVLGRNADGFHDLRTTFQAIELHDTLEIEAAPATGLEVTGLQLKEAGENSVLKAQRALERAAGRELPARMQLHKRIPPGSGLGGASSDAAAALRGLTAIYALGVTSRRSRARSGPTCPSSSPADARVAKVAASASCH
jgi:4-diphosphocytidyl-2-C-methyl-D-erythritol kinase